MPLVSTQKTNRLSDVRQNHLLLSRSLETMRHIIGGLCAAPTPPVYNDSGRILPLPVSGRFLSEALC